MSDSGNDIERGEETRRSEENSKDGQKKNAKKDAKKKLKPTHIIIGVLVIALIAAGIAVYYLLTREPEVVSVSTPSDYVSGARGTVVTRDNLQDILDELNRPIEDGYYTVSMTVDWVFETGGAPSETARVRNREDNTRTVYFDVFLEEDGRLVYSSPFIPLGGLLENFALHEYLPAGEYPARVVYYLVDDDESIITDVTVSVNITILS